MALSNTWSVANEIYNVQKNEREPLTKVVYRSANGFEAFVVGETETAWLIEGNGVKCSIHKHTTKSNLHKVSDSYELKYFSYSK